jgi:hypothetical protein
MDPHRLRCRSLDQHAEERPIIGVVEEDRGPVDTAQNGVQRKAGCDDACVSGALSVCRLVSRRCRNISAMRRFVPGSSQNRTWSVTPSGSQPESFAVEQGSESCALSTPHRRHPPQCRASRAPPQGQPRQLRETRERQCHGQSSRCRAVFHSRVVSGRHPNARPRITRRHSSYGWLRLPRTTARVLAFTLVRGCPPPADRCADLPGYHVFSMSGSTRPRTPGSIRAARQSATRIVAYRRDKTVGTLQPKFSGLNTFRVGSTRYLCTSPAYRPTHRRACYQPRRKARYWARGSRLPRRDFHPLEHAALPGRTVPTSPHWEQPHA